MSFTHQFRRKEDSLKWSSFGLQVIQGSSRRFDSFVKGHDRVLPRFSVGRLPAHPACHHASMRAAEAGRIIEKRHSCWADDPR